MSNALRFSAFSIAVFALAGCVSARPPENVACAASEAFRLPVEIAPLPGSSSRAAMRSAENVIAGAMMESDPARHALAARNIAILSGGGAFGAYGAGLLQSFLGGRDLHFDVVTGVSTGAVQATAVFLGGADDMAALSEGYDIEREEDLARRRPDFGGLPLEASLYTLEPARARFDAFLTDARIERVAAAAREGRKLLVGAVEVQDGKFYAFDLTAIAASARPLAERKRCYSEAVFASAAVPVTFPPVLLDGRQYFDGGVRASVFYDASIDALETLHERTGDRANIYIVFNDYLDTPATDDYAVTLTDVIARTRDITFDQIDRDSLQAVARLRGEFDIGWTRVPPGLCQAAREEAPDEKVFNAPFMRCLLGEGRAAGAGASPFMRIE